MQPNMGKYKYSDSEKEMLKVLKMQESQLQNLDESIHNNSEDLDALIQQAESLMLRRGLDPTSIKKESADDFKLHVSKDSIRSWESITEQANNEITDNIELEDLLSAKEFQFCIDEVQRINDEFANKTGILNKKDMSFLVVATALQTARWLIIQELMGDLGETINKDERLAHNDKSINDKIKESNKSFQDAFSNELHRDNTKNYRSCEQILTFSAPFDTTVGSPMFNEKLEGGYHRYKTLGHDPILGWIFGTANFITDTCTLSNFNSYRISRIQRPHFSEPVSLPEIFYEVFDSTQEDWLRLPAGLFAEFVHLKSDAFSKVGLPVPVLETFSESLAGDLYRSQYDALCLIRDMKIVGNQTAWSILINMIIGLLHGFFYDDKKDINHKLYEVRTRKILCISNALASSGNIIYSVCTEDLGKLDIGGILVSLYRLFTDVRFITKVKEEFIKKEMDKVLENELKSLDSYFD